MPPKITVIIPTFNRAEYLAECLDSLFQQTLPPFQVVVVNDGSSDQTRKILIPYLSAIDYIETYQSGKSVALNKGMEKVSGDYVWIFDDDDVALPDALERFVEPLEGNHQYGFSYGTFLLAAPRIEDGRIGTVIGESNIPDLKKKGFLIPLLEGDFLGGAAFFARTACYRHVGNFDPALIRSQDYEMVVRIAFQFEGVRVRGGSTFYYRQHKGQRGSLRDRFESELRHKNWLKYDQMFFRRLYHEIPLIEYLPPGWGLEDNIRQAYLQRMRVMASKLLIAEVLQDLDAMAQLPHLPAYSSQERELVSSLLFVYPYYQSGSIYYDYPEFFGEIRRLSSTSCTIQQFRREILRANLNRLNEKRLWEKPKQIYSIVLRSARLFLPY